MGTRHFRPTCDGLKRAAFAVLLATTLAGCAGTSLKDDHERDAPSYAAAPAETGVLHDMATRIGAAHGDDHSGFHLLDSSEDGLNWRLALIDSAQTSVDIQTYLWYADHSGRLMLDRAIRAAARGVQVRLIVDDLLTIGMDDVLVALEDHPNIQLRIFNPWKKRGLAARGGEMIMELRRLNIRMHDKLMIADGHATVVGGRNIGDHYFGLSDAYNFHDLDVLGFGPVATQASEFFDHFWNSEWVVSADAIDLEASQEEALLSLEAMREKIEAADALDAFSRLPKDWSAELAELEPELHPGRSMIVYDRADGETMGQEVAASLFPAMSRAQEELLITNAYIIPEQRAIDFVQGLTERGVRVAILTNSLASHDVPAVNSHYRDWRDDFIGAGAELFELRSDAQIQSLVDVPPTQGEFVGLHTKAFVIDRELSFIGSMNFDPRSVNINSEGGVYIESEGLAVELAELMERDMAPENAWQVFLDDEGELYWVNGEERVDRQPARDSWQRFMDVFFKLFPKDYY